MSGAGRLPIGRIGRPHGVRGEVTLLPLVDVDNDDVDDAEILSVGAVFDVGSRSLEISSSRRHRRGWLVRFVGVETRNDAEALRGTVLSVDERGDAENPDVVGFDVRDRSGTVLGTVIAVEPNPAHDILVLADGVMIPVPFVIDVAPGVVTVDPPEGLLELYRP
ncbi:MAG: ribosome maturation factor RimM [Acidimicrobiia bacterium]|nr:ribosome maturation factor RimM [Acidimicrobiia bacterium]